LATLVVRLRNRRWKVLTCLGTLYVPSWLP
jgi:hypothetical protein